KPPTTSPPPTKTQAPTITFFRDFPFELPPLMASPPLRYLRWHPAGSRPLPPARSPPRRSGHFAALFSPRASQNRSSFSTIQTNAPIRSQYFGTEPPAHCFLSQDRGPWPLKGPAKAADRSLAPENVP